VKEIKNETIKESAPEKESQGGLIDNLSDEEKQLLRKYIDKDVKFLNLPKDDKVAMGLVEKKILFTPQIYFHLPAKSFTLSKWALSYLEKFPEKLI
jgi:hypothetical protein